jgi:hypothetical protein
VGDNDFRSFQSSNFEDGMDDDDYGNFDDGGFNDDYDGGYGGEMDDTGGGVDGVGVDADFRSQQQQVMADPAVVWKSGYLNLLEHMILQLKKRFYNSFYSATDPRRPGTVSSSTGPCASPAHSEPLRTRRPLS